MAGAARRPAESLIGYNQAIANVIPPSPIDKGRRRVSHHDGAIPKARSFQSTPSDAISAIPSHTKDGPGQGCPTIHG